MPSAKYQMNAPTILIQVHYHLRNGGVRRVMEELSNSFLNLIPSGQSIFCVGGKNSNQNNSNAQIYHYAQLDYCDNIIEDELKAQSAKIHEFLLTIINKSMLSGPVLVLGQNINLSKNLALSLAFSQLVEECKSSDQVRFSIMVHDLAEENRPDRMTVIRAAETAGLPARKMLWPNCHYISVNKRNLRILELAGYSASYLPNRISFDPKTCNIDKNALMRALHKVASSDKISIQNDGGIIFYPVRVIERKNLPEAILVFTILTKNILLVGSCGHGDSDRSSFVRLKKLVSRLKLPVIFEADRISSICNAGFSSLYLICDHAISTAKSEGFGYGIYEPYLYGKKLAGRLPHGLEEDGIIDLSNLYHSLPIPDDFPIFAGSEDFAKLTIEDREQILEIAGSDITAADILRKSWLPMIDSGSEEQLTLNARKILQLSVVEWDKLFLDAIDMKEGKSSAPDPMLIESLVPRYQ